MILYIDTLNVVIHCLVLLLFRYPIGLILSKIKIIVSLGSINCISPNRGEGVIYSCSHTVKRPKNNRFEKIDVGRTRIYE
jgi:hypothetical protein